RGFPSQCQRMLGGVKFGNSKDGVLAEYFHVNDAEANLVPIQATIPDEAAVYATDMMPTGIMGASNAGIPAGGTVAVFAQGPVGLMATAGARLLGAGLVIAVESIPKRKALSKQFGADRVVDFIEVDPVKEILRLTEGKGVDSAIESLGAQNTFEACVKVTRPEYIGIPRAEWGFGMGEKTIRTGLCPGGKELMRRMLRLLETGRVDPSPLTTHVFEFSELDRAFRMMKTKADDIIKDRAFRMMKTKADDIIKPLIRF
ncbi:MAG: zinc-binding dehydrogenase, partial [Deltaproteobacteria bacterium]|nr:zinc-binding dehydrogenase [Deltaproteobacteria bacterium]